MQNIINISSLNKLDNQSNNPSTIKVADIDSINPSGADTSVFQSMLQAAVNPINSAENSLAINLYNLQKQGSQVDPSQLITLQTNSNQLFVAATVVSKGVNMTVKAINELTHIQ